jgi:sugar lactone lactonase YvrE
MVRTLAAEAVLDVRADVGEGPAWDAARDRLVWVDITAGKVHVYDPVAGTDQAHDVGRHVGAAVPTVDSRLLLAVPDGLALLDNTVRMVAEVEADRPGNRMNDAKCDPQGRLWAGTMPYEHEPGAAGLYRFDGVAVEKVLSGLTLSNGLGWSPDGTVMYFIDSGTQRVDAFHFDGGEGAISGRRTVVEIDPAEGMPDGMTVDHDGCLWVALWGGGQVRRYTPSGRLDAVVELPATQVTSCAFGGRRSDVLYVTSAAYRLTPEQLSAQPRAGNLFAVEPGVAGPAATPFTGTPH